MRCAYIGPVGYFVGLGISPGRNAEVSDCALLVRAAHRNITSGPAPRQVTAYALLPLLAMGGCALPHFRACFSKVSHPSNHRRITAGQSPIKRSPPQARGPSEQGETMSLIAALESLPSLLASPLASLAFRYTLASPEGARPVLGACAAGPALAMLLLRYGGFNRRIESPNGALSGCLRVPGVA